MRITVTLSDPLNERVENIQQNTGLSKSEIARRGILEQVKELEVKS